MSEHKNPVFSFLEQFLAGFGAAVIVFSLCGVTFGESAKDISLLFNLGSVGMSYRSLLQIFLCIIVLQGIRALLFSNVIFKTMMLLWRIVLFMTTGLLTTGIVAVLCKWIPSNNWKSWMGLVLSYSLCIGVSTTIMVIKTRHEDKKYSRLLSEYKAKLKD